MDHYTQLIVKIQTGDDVEASRRAFDELMIRFQGMAFKQALQTLSDLYLAQDAVQEAFLAAYLNLHRLHDPKAFPTWLRRIVLTQCDRLVRNKQPQLESIAAHFDLAAESPSPEMIVEAQEIRQRILAAIAALPEHERAVTEGFYMQGHSQKELAELLQVPVTTVKKRLQYARQHLRGLISDLNAAFDQAIADMLHPPKPQRQPVYIYNHQRGDKPDDI